MKIAILGYAGQGKSAYEYWDRPENELTICDRDTNIEVPDRARTQLGDDYLQGLDQYDLLIRTPSLHPKDIADANPDAPNILDKVWTNTNEFLKVCPSRNIIGITGTKGKGTTSTLVARILEAAGKRVHLGGNIGTPPLELLKDNIQAEDYVVLELANFQLIDIKSSPRIAVCLMMVPEHLDWHADYNEYIEAKQQLFHWQTEDGVAIYYANNPDSKRVVASGKGQKIPYFQAPGAEVKNGAIYIDNQTVCATNELKLLGEHNWQNVCAAVTAVWQVTQNIPAMREVLLNFTGLEHRLELVRELDGIKYYDDSFGTTPETAIVAIRAFNEPKVVILGGSDKGASFDDLAKVVTSSNVRSVVTIGNTSPAIAEALRSQGFEDITEGGITMAEIVAAARSQAQSGDVVLLSTGCASFGLFKDYKDRGDQFKRAVGEL